MIIGTITIIFLLFGSGGGFSFDIFNDAVKDVIADKQIFEQIKSITEAADTEMKNWHKEAKKISEQFVKMNQNYNMKKEEMDIFFEQADSQREEVQEKIIKLRFQAKNLMTRQEWEAMYAKVDENKK